MLYSVLVGAVGTAVAVVLFALKKLSEMGEEAKGGEDKIESLSTVLGWGASALRFIGPPGRAILRLAKERASYHQYRELHEVVHSLRKVAHNTDGNVDPFCQPQTAFDICTSLRKLMGNLLELDENQLNCCLKVVEKSEDGNDRVATLGRSIPFDNRTGIPKNDQPREVGKNSVWASLLGREDRLGKWSLFRCFACNDLKAHPTAFDCDRPEWQDFYQAAMVFPLRYHRNIQSSDFVTFGFLAFDSPKKGAFRNVPDIIECRKDWIGYHSKIEKSVAFQAGAVCADVLSALLRKAYEDQDNG